MIRVQVGLIGHMLVCLEKHYSRGMTYMLGRGIVGRSHEGVKDDWCRTMAGVGGGTVADRSGMALEGEEASIEMAVKK